MLHTHTGIPFIGEQKILESDLPSGHTTVNNFSFTTYLGLISRNGTFHMYSSVNWSYTYNDSFAVQNFLSEKKPTRLYDSFFSRILTSLAIENYLKDLSKS